MRIIGCALRQVWSDKLLRQLLTQVSTVRLRNSAGIDPKWISECAKDLAAITASFLVVAGQRQPMEVHLLAHAINSALGAIGNTRDLCFRRQDNAGADFNGTFERPAAIDTLVILGGNPVYHLNWTSRAKSRKRLFGWVITRTKLLKSATGIFRRRIISNRGAMRRRATERWFQFSH